MPPWIKQWLAWAMSESPWNRPRPTDQAVHIHYEKAGLRLLALAVPWNADGVIIELLAKLPPAARVRSDFTLRIPGCPAVTAESLRMQESGSDRCRIFFKLPVPPSTVVGEILWKQKLLTSVTVLVQSSSDFFGQLKLLNPTLSVRMGGSVVAAQTMIASQCQGLIAAALLKSPTPLAPLADVSLQVRFEGLNCPEPVPLRLTANQLSGKECLLLATPPKPPRRVGSYEVSWLLNDREIHRHRLIGLTSSRFLQSVRIAEMRFVWADASGRIQVSRQAPATGEATRLGPCFVLASREPGAAGLLELQVCALMSDGTRWPLAANQMLLVTDGPALLAPGLINLAEMPGLIAFELRFKNRLLGTAPLAPVPQAKFDSEGGFQPAPDFQWTNIADEELTERLHKLFGEGRG